MKIAIMQPYLFPYIGYFQLIRSVDRFILYDDVQFIKEGWIHRNRLLLNGQDKSFTIPLQKGSHTARINEKFIAAQRWEKERRKLLTMIRQNYANAPCFGPTFDLIEECLSNPTGHLADFIEYALVRCCRTLEISTEIIRSSTLRTSLNLKGQDRVLAICKAQQAEHYINAIGGQELYDRATFQQQGIRLSFIKTHDIHYPQFKNEFVPWLSIIDMMMFNPMEKIRAYLDMYELV